MVQQLKIFLSLVFFFCVFSLLAEEKQDSIDQMLDGLNATERIVFWEDWFSEIDPQNPILWEVNQEQACTNAFQKLSEKEAYNWCFNLKLQFAEDLLFHNFYLKSEKKFDHLKKELDSLSILGQAKETLLAKWNITYAAARYSKFQDIDSTTLYFKNAEKLIAKLDDPKLSFQLWKEQARVRFFEKDTKIAIDLLKKINTLALDLNTKERLKLRILKARIFSQNKQYQEADLIYNNLLDSLQFLDTFNNFFYQISYVEHLCHLNTNQEIDNLLDKLRIDLDSLNAMPLIRDFSNVACRFYSRRGQFEKCQFLYIKYRDNYNEEVVKERNRIIKNLEEKLEFSKKKAQIQELQQEQTIKNNQFRMRLAGIIALIISGVLILLFYLKRNRNRRKELALSIEKNKEIAENRDHLFSTITHDIRTPLSLMMAPLERAVTHAQNPQAIQDLKLAQRSGKRLMELFNQILDWNKAEAQAMKLNPQAGALVFSLQTLCWRFLDQAKEKGVVFNSEILLPEGQYVLDYDKMDKILSNLVGNAIKFCNSNKKITLTADWKEGQMTLMVSDNGPGISEEDQAKLFDRHYQGEQGKIKGGTGIGLALVKELIEMMSGKISLESQLGLGASFTIQLPVKRLSDKKAREQTLTKDTNESNLAESKKPMILLIEDEPDLLTFLASALEIDYTVKVANSSSIGLSIACSQIPDMIISDWSLPDYNGGWLCQKIRENELTSHIPVMILTAFSSDENLKEVLDSGAIARMNKPFQLEALHDQVKNILNQQRKTQNSWSSTREKEQNDEETIVKIDPFLEKALKVIEANLMDQHFSIEKMASILDLSRAQLFRKIKNTTGHSPIQLLSIKRLEAAQRLLKNTAQNIADISATVGFSDPNYFSNAYKKHFGHTPRQERK